MTEAEMTKPRLGHINFLNVLPFTYGLQQTQAQQSLELVNGVPAVVNNALLAGRADAAEVSAAAYARHFRELVLLPGFCVRADDAVKSILLVAKKPIEQIRDDKVILTAQSATAHTLLRLIMARAYGAKPRYFTRRLQPENPVPQDASAALFIGDDALSIYWHKDEEHYYYYDLGREWHKLTGHGMVYAVWAARREFAAANPAGLQLVCAKLAQGFQLGSARLPEAIRSVQGSKPFSVAQLTDYFTVIKWDLAAAQVENLQLFYNLAYEEGLIPDLPEIEFLA